jgi:hypothetical protein
VFDNQQDRLAQAQTFFAQTLNHERRKKIQLPFTFGPHLQSRLVVVFEAILICL